MTRQFTTIAVLAVLGCAAPQLKLHISAGINVGITEERVVEIIAWAIFFGGAPAAYNALGELKATLPAGSTATPGINEAGSMNRGFLLQCLATPPVPLFVRIFPFSKTKPHNSTGRQTGRLRDRHEDQQ